MKLSVLVALCSFAFSATVFVVDWPMSNDPGFDTSVENPMYENAKGPVIRISFDYLTRPKTASIQPVWDQMAWVILRHLQEKWVKEEF